jgi:hypothetical protein
MFEIMKKMVATRDLKRNTQGLENINNKIENTAKLNEREDLFKKAEQVEMELDKIEKIMGISAEEMMSLYKTITPEDARDIVTKTIERISDEVKKGAIWTADNLNQHGGGIIFWASKKSPREAVMIAASVMILVLGTGVVQEALADEIGSMETVQMSDENIVNESNSNAAQDSLGELEVVSVPKGMSPELNGGLMVSEDAGVNQEHKKIFPGVRSGGETVQELEKGRYGNSHSIDSPEDGVSMGIFKDN